MISSWRHACATPPTTTPTIAGLSTKRSLLEMAKVYEKYPDHHEVAVVYGVALFMLEERRGYRDVNDPDLIRLHGVLVERCWMKTSATLALAISISTLPNRARSPSGL